MKSCAQYIAEIKARKSPHASMSDRELGVLLGGYSQQSIAAAKFGKMTDPLAVKIAEALEIEAGEVIWVARTERERDPTVRKHLEAWGEKVGKVPASVLSRAASAIGALAVALGLSFLPSHDLQTVGGEGAH